MKGDMGHQNDRLWAFMETYTATLDYEVNGLRKCTLSYVHKNQSKPLWKRLVGLYYWKYILLDLPCGICQMLFC